MENINNWYEFTLAQIAADSYLDGINYYNYDDLARRLRNGANHYDALQKNIEDDNLSATRMTEQMVNDFNSTWEIVTHLPNTSSGFSATLFKHKVTGEYTLSFRSTESKDKVDGGL